MGIKTRFICQNCSHIVLKWMGKCPECEQWNSFEEETVSKNDQILKTKSHQICAKRISELSHENYKRIQSGKQEFDRVMGGGVVPGSLTLIGGEPGIGKSTLLMELSALFSKLENTKVLYVSGEESENQLATRSARLDVKDSSFFILNETSWENIKNVLKKEKPHFLILDSIQTTVSEEIAAAAGSVSQIREVTFELMNFIKANNISSFVIGHVTKEGSIAGPKILEHMVDAVIYFEGDQLGQYRLLRTIKNRFGNTNEVGVFEMKEEGLVEVRNPSAHFLDKNLSTAYGRSIGCVVEGSRNLLFEVQGLVIENKLGNIRRNVQGIDGNRLAMIIAILEKYFEMPMSVHDIYINIVGGIKISTRDSDLGIIACLLSSLKQKPVASNRVFIGEVGLTGEVRPVPFIERRLRELDQLGYKSIVVCKSIAEKYRHKYALNIIGIDKAKELTQVLF